MRQERLLSVGTDGGGYINLLCTNKDDLSLSPPTPECWPASAPHDIEMDLPP